MLSEHAIRPSRKRGQNFLIDSNILKVIEREAHLSSEDVIIEIGAGLGALTQILVERCLCVFSIEQDKRLSSILSELLRDKRNLKIISADALSLDLADLLDGSPAGKVKMVANLPYGIASALLLKCIENYPFISEYVVMVQKEVAKRLSCGPGQSDYSSLSVKIQSRSEVKILSSVSRNCFYPRPRVDSSLLRITPFGESELESHAPRIENLEFFTKLVNASFAQRRKKLKNSLLSVNKSIDRESLSNALRVIGKSEDARAQDLLPFEFVRLSNILFRES
ncbi:MAG: 16S rRNA (adenine(1518)-N(6)/adenine(1519)-N(6))-dimethyltransferase RsmA [Actinomycetota bacterium]|nr:16S rRNA (adenine(1518)-N(6)/adenine(1519)-N(6))-dimethyltransferase RsmA [Actinomycetota bacterium]